MRISHSLQSNQSWTQCLASSTAAVEFKTFNVVGLGTRSNIDPKSGSLFSQKQERIIWNPRNILTIFNITNPQVSPAWNIGKPDRFATQQMLSRSNSPTELGLPTLWPSPWVSWPGPLRGYVGTKHQVVRESCCRDGSYLSMICCFVAWNILKPSQQKLLDSNILHPALAFRFGSCRMPSALGAVGPFIGSCGGTAAMAICKPSFPGAPHMMIEKWPPPVGEL